MEADVGGGRLGNREVVSALTLGLGLVTFDLLDSGLWAHEICRFTLSLVRRGLHLPCDEGDGGIWVHGVGKESEVDAGLVPLVCMDVFNCFARRQMPLCRLEMNHDGEQRVDKYLGLCGPLLTMLFDICRLNHQLGALETSNQRLAASTRAEIFRELGDIGDKVLVWNPRVPEAFAFTTPPEEVWRIQAQAEIYRAVALLIIHRLRYGSGTQDEEACRLSKTILADIEKVYAHAPPSDDQAENVGFDCRLAFPFFVAATEVEDPGERIHTLDRLPSVVCEEIYSRVIEQLRQALTFIWDARDWRCCTHWFDLVPTSIPPFVLF